MALKLLHKGTAWIAVIVLSGWAGLAQVSTPKASAPVQGDHSSVPDAPSPVPIRINTQSALTQLPIPSAPGNELTVLEDTPIWVMTDEPVNSKLDKIGTSIRCTVTKDVVVGDVLAIPRGATVHAMVMRSSKAGVLTGSPELTLELVSLDLGARTYPLYTEQFQVKGISKSKPTEIKARRGAWVGALVGGALGSPRANGGTTEVGRVASMATGAAVGAGVGTMVSAATPGPGILIPAETEVDFDLAAPITVTPVNAKEAARLAQGMRYGGPHLYVRDDVR